jgi:NADH-quinone oxidoreductase subunit M
LTLAGLILAPMFGGLLAWAAERRRSGLGRWVAAASLGLVLCWLVLVWGSLGPDVWGLRQALPWIPQLGIGFRLELDGLSLVLCLLTAFLGLMAVAASWTSVTERAGFFHLNLLWTLGGVLGVFLARDLFLFFLFWELMLVPMFLLIRLWGHVGRERAAMKFLLFTQGSGLLLLLGVLLLVLGRREVTGELTFAFSDVPLTGLAPDLAFAAALCLFLAFAVKLPMLPLHVWLADAHSEAPTGASVILAGVLLKTGAYGLVRLLLPWFPDVSVSIAPIAMTLGVTGILYGALLAFAQQDLKRLVACSSISHMGFVVVGVFAWSPTALHGVVLQMVAHGISAAALFLLVGALEQRLGTRDMARMGGFWGEAPRMASLGLLFALATLGLPGLGNFVGELLVLLGALRDHPVAVGVALAGMVTAAVYALAMIQRVFHGPRGHGEDLSDCDARESVSMGLLAGLILWLGLYPGPVLDTVIPALDALDRDQVMAVEAPGRGTS